MNNKANKTKSTLFSSSSAPKQIARKTSLSNPPLSSANKPKEPISYGGRDLLSGKKVDKISSGNENHALSQPQRANSMERPPKQSIDNDYHNPSKNKHPLSPTTIDNTTNFRRTSSNNVKDKVERFDTRHTHVSPTNGNEQSTLSGATTLSQDTKQMYNKANYESHSTSPTGASYGSSSSSKFHRQATILPSTPPITHKYGETKMHASPIFPNWNSNNSPEVITSINHPQVHNTTQQFPRQVNKPICGLKNLGNTCFMNCILQCLSHTLPLRQFYVSRDYKQTLTKRGDLSGAFSNVMVELWDVPSHSVAPYELKRQVGYVAPRFSGYNQHDAQEFMRFLLNELHDEINKASVKGRKPPADNETLKDACARYLTWENSWISELFGGMLRSVVCCTVCYRTSTVYDPFMDLALPIPKGKSTYPRAAYQYSFSYDVSHDSAVLLTDCLEKFTDEETLDEEERPYCNKCKKLTKSTKQLGVAKLPRFLVIQLKRFSGYQVRTKLSTPVSFDNTWHLVDADKKSHTYSLYGIVSHSGGIYGGHYTAYCKYDGIWRCFNDTMCREFSWEYVKLQEAYMLFYEKEAII